MLLGCFEIECHWVLDHNWWWSSESQSPCIFAKDFSLTLNC